MSQSARSASMSGRRGRATRRVERRGVVAELEARAVVERAPVRAAHELQRLSAGDRIEGDPGHRQVLAGDGEVGAVLVPGRAPGLAALLQEHLLVHEPDVGRAPEARRRMAGMRRGLQHGAIARQAVRVVEVLVEGAVASPAGCARRRGRDGPGSSRRRPARRPGPRRPARRGRKHRRRRGRRSRAASTPVHAPLAWRLAPASTLGRARLAAIVTQRQSEALDERSRPLPRRLARARRPRPAGRLDGRARAWRRGPIEEAARPAGGTQNILLKFRRGDRWFMLRRPPLARAHERQRDHAPRGARAGRAGRRPTCRIRG